MTEGQLFSVFLADSFRILFGWGPELQAFRKPVSDVSDCDHHEWVQSVSRPCRSHSPPKQEQSDAKTLLKALSCVRIIASFSFAYTKLFMFAFDAWHSRIIQEPGSVEISEWLQLLSHRVCHCFGSVTGQSETFGASQQHLIWKSRTGGRVIFGTAVPTC